ncbi:SufD family Fe-S cluster assembly protein [Candidatus Peregrinibacteria bacterium]|nr:SufD family Fe-S cluster assembly protein [Candidatus Peregrinibacteria bacterium]
MHLTPLKPSSIHILCQGQEALVRVPAGMVVESPIELGLEASNSEAPISLRIEVGKGSKATVVVRLEGDAHLKSLEFKQTIVAEEGSQLRVVEFQALSTSTTFIAHRDSEAKKEASLENIVIQIGGQTTEGTLNQKANGSEVKLNPAIFILAKTTQRHRFNLNNFFAQEMGGGNSTIKCIAQDQSSIETLGTIGIGRHGTGTESGLRMDSLLLSREARIAATPALEIGTNDVKVGHGASVSNLNEENMFYLASRGIAPDEARRMMVRGFVSDVTDRLNDLPELRDEILSLI